MSQLSLNEAFANRSEKDQLAYFKKLCASQNEALDLMQKERNEWAAKAKRWERCVEEAQKAFDTQKSITHNLVTKANADDQAAHARIRTLEHKVRELGGNLNQLGD